MSVQKIVKIFEKLENLTSEGKIDWEQTEKDDVFQTAFPNFSLRLASLTGDYYIYIYNNQGVLLESASDVDLVSEMNNAPQRMRTLHKSARGYALGAEKALDEILKELDEKDLPF